MLAGKVVLACIFVLATFADLRWRKIPNMLILVGLALYFFIMAWLFFTRRTPLAFDSLKAGGIAFLIHLIPYIFGQMGAGDVKLAFLVGALLGWESWMLYLAAYCAVLVLTAVVLFTMGSRKPKSLPLAPLMATAYVIMIFASV